MLIAYTLHPHCHLQQLGLSYLFVQPQTCIATNTLSPSQIHHQCTSTTTNSLNHLTFPTVCGLSCLMTHSGLIIYILHTLTKLHSSSMFTALGLCHQNSPLHFHHWCTSRHHPWCHRPVNHQPGYVTHHHQQTTPHPAYISLPLAPDMLPCQSLARVCSSYIHEPFLTITLNNSALLLVCLAPDTCCHGHSPLHLPRSIISAHSQPPTHSTI